MLENVGWFIAGAAVMGVVWQWVEYVVPAWHRNWARKHGDTEGGDK